MEKVTVKINPKNQEFEVDINGVQGADCLEITKNLLESNEEISQQLTAESVTPEYLPDYVEDQGEE